jgi:diadenosine tetraphosphate (Ap4A) HIT family hydrolase
MTDIQCNYCSFDEYNVIAQNEFGVVIPEPLKLSNGHSVIIPLRHVASFFDLTEKERKSLMALLEQARNELKIRYQPTGFHIGFNEGEIFNQTADHLHIHIIPRYNDQMVKLDQRWGFDN